MASRENPNRVDVIRSEFARQCAHRRPSRLYLRPRQYAVYVSAHGQPEYNGIPVAVTL